MRTAATGFLLGYLTIALLIAPALLCALEVSPTYSDGVTTVLSRTGVLKVMHRYGNEAETMRDQAARSVSHYVASKLWPHELIGQ